MTEQSQLPQDVNHFEQRGNDREKLYRACRTNPIFIVSSSSARTPRSGGHAFHCSGRGSQAVKPEKRIAVGVADAVKRLKRIRMALGPDLFDGKALGVGHVVRSLARVYPGHDKKLNSLRHGGWPARPRSRDRHGPSPVGSWAKPVRRGRAPPVDNRAAASRDGRRR